MLGHYRPVSRLYQAENTGMYQAVALTFKYQIQNQADTAIRVIRAENNWLYTSHTFLPTKMAVPKKDITGNLAELIVL